MMKVPSLNVPGLRRRKADGLPGVTAVARIDRRTKRLTKRLQAGEIAIIDTSTSTGSAGRRSRHALRQP